MATAIAGAATDHAGVEGRSTHGSVAQIGALSRRSVLNIWRQPQVWVPSVLFPLLFAALNTAALGKTPGRIFAVTGLHAFGPTDRYLDFLFVATLTQGVLFGALSGGSELAQDIEGGFFDRLVTTPVSRTAILVGRLAGSAALGFVQGLLFLGVFLAFGAHIRGGVPGALVLPVAAMLLSLGIGGLTCAVAIRTGSVEAVQGAFPLIFITLFISSAFFPTVLMKGWYRAVATHNPLSLMINGMRHQVLFGFDASEALKAVSVPLALSALSIGLCLVTLRDRLAQR